MAPLTTAEIIANADYLNDGFDPSKLTIPQLLGVLSHHGIPYTGNAKKTQLISLFEQEIRGNIDELREQRLALDGSQASDRGITDGISGRQINDPETPPQPRRSSRRSSARPSAEPQEVQVKPSRASAGPSNGRARSRGRRAIPEPEIVEVSESESEEEARPTRPVRKSAKGTVADPKPKRASSKFGEDSGWEDNNVFQSGPEDSPPAKPYVPPRRSSLNPSTSRITPRNVSSASVQEVEANKPSAPRSSTRPHASTAPTTNALPVTPNPKPSSRTGRRVAVAAPITPSSPESVTPSSSSPPEAEDDVVEETHDEEDVLDQANEAVEHNNAVLDRIADLSSKGAAVVRHVEPSSRTITSTLGQLFLALLAVLTLTTGGIYKTESAAIGFCDAGLETNSILSNLRTQRELAHVCNARLIADGPDPGSDDPHSRLVDGVVCPLESLLPVPPPDSCTPCPKRATCDRSTVTCNGAFILQPHPVVKYIPGIEKILGGLPGFGSVAFPPQCVEDRRWLKQVGMLEKALESWLAKAKGDKICKGLAKGVSDGGDAKAWGVAIDQLRVVAKKSMTRRIPVANLDSLFDDATAKLEKHGLLVSEVDSNGTRWIAALRSDMDLVCHAKVLANDAWDAWRSYLYSLLLIIGGATYARSRVAARRVETRRVADLVQIALDTLRSQELAHHTDPVSTPYGYLSSMHLRDLILQDEHSAKTRQRVWKKVERVVEGNANVRATMEELNGDETRAWQWTGGITSVSPRRVQWTGSTKDEDA